MPLIIITGLPTSGKSTRAAQLHEYLQERIAADSSQHRLHLVSDETQEISRTVYDLSQLPAHVRSANASEKDARAAVYGAVKRVLSPRDIVVLDGLNYIKGWRYQLFCEAKNVRTPSVVLQVGCAKEKAKEINEQRLRKRESRRQKEKTEEAQVDQATELSKENIPAGSPVNQDQHQDQDNDEEPYEPENWENLVFRYEEPNPMTRWDSPLFTLIWEDDEKQTKDVFNNIWEAIAGEGRKAVKPNMVAVHRVKDHGGDFLYYLERETQDIVKRILEQQSEEGGGEVKITRGGDVQAKDLVVDLPAKKVGLPQLQRYRRAFVSLNRGGIGLETVGNLAVARLRESFVGYLNDAFENDG